MWDLTDPELLIDAAGYLGKQVGGIRIAHGRRLADGLPDGLAERCQRVGNSECVMLLVSNAESIGHEEGALRRNLNGAVRGAAESVGALGNKVGIVFDIRRDLVEQFVDCDESRSAYVPLRLFT